MNSLDAEWQRYAIAANAAPDQQQAMRRAFYAGAMSFWRIVRRGLSPEGEPTEEDLKRLTDMGRELEQFGKDVRAGKA